ncbi:hypothetical protein F7R15_18845 [Pseudomonas reinekei]|uniref:Uncharacterized protein n=1 Tax=Pseudomonas reinekei TaxID=395598 RepID=A0A6H9RQ04_PSERE|nr:hypothetical protein F7R15_18845 [Pseudomonas reinekei]
MGASLLAKAVCQPTKRLNDNPPSRAGSLPQWFRVDLQALAAAARISAFISETADLKPTNSA